jgi:predicted nucleotidyltransferase/predicted transcriptional regulator
MSTKGIAESLFSLTRRKVLGELVRTEERPIHLRELARRIGLDPAGVQRELKNLVNSGIVIEEKSGNQKSYSLNRKNPVYNELRMLLIKTVSIAEGIKEMLQRYSGNIKFAYIYGSFADATADARSDIDLMIVGETGLRGMAKDIAKLSGELSRDVNPTTYTLSEYRQRVSEKGSFVNKVHNGPKIILLGDPDES